MIKIGILGEIGSGKSFVAKNFLLPLFNADYEVIKIYKSNKKCFRLLKKKFPKDITNFPIDKNELSRLILKKQSNLKILGNIIHPFVQANLRKFLKKNVKRKAIVLDIPLLVENKLYDKSTILVYVDASKKNITKKLIKRGNFNSKIYSIMKKSQKTKKFKKKISKFVIKNNFKYNETKNKIKKIKKIILK